MAARVTAAFVEPMLLLRTEQLPDDGARWFYELKVDGYRAIAFKANSVVHLRSRRDNDFTARYPRIVDALASLPGDTVIDGELVAFDDEGRPSFGALQNAVPSRTPVVFYVFDVLVIAGRDVTRETLERRRALLERKVMPVLEEPIRFLGALDASLADLIASVRAQQFEGLVAKRRDSRYEPGVRSGAWQKMRVSQGQELVIGGYTPGSSSFDALVVGYYHDGQLHYAARTRNGFTPASRAQLMKKFRGLELAECPFVNLPETKSGRWGQGLTATKMKDCRWLRPVLVGQFEFVEWTDEHHLRHSRFVALREDKAAEDVTRR